MKQWKILQTDALARWFLDLDDDAKEDILAKVMVLSALGPALGRPSIDTLKGSRFSNLKELRVQSLGRPFRIIRRAKADFISN